MGQLWVMPDEEYSKNGIPLVADEHGVFKNYEKCTSPLKNIVLWAKLWKFKVLISLYLLNESQASLRKKLS